MTPGLALVSVYDMLGHMQVQSIVNAMRGSHNRVEAAICMYARMVDKENLWMVLYALKVQPSNCVSRLGSLQPCIGTSVMLSRSLKGCAMTWLGAVCSCLFRTAQELLAVSHVHL